MTHRETHLENTALDKYAIGEFVAAGGFAEVYKARDMRLSIDVAIKVLKPSQADPATVSRFRDEAMRVANLQHPKPHPNIINVLDVGESHGYHWLAMSMLEGETLADRLARGALPLHEATRVIGLVADALDHAHSRSLIHRDVKPSNIFLTRDGGVVLMDFGLVREQHSADGTRTMSIIGTPEYMSPEQIQAKGLTYRSDIYSLGLVAFEAITGRAAFPHVGGNTWQVLEQQVKASLPAMRRSDGSTVPDYVEAAIKYATAKNAAERWPSAGAMAKALKTPSSALPPTRQGEPVRIQPPVVPPAPPVGPANTTTSGLGPLGPILSVFAAAAATSVIGFGLCQSRTLICLVPPPSPTPRSPEVTVASNPTARAPEKPTVATVKPTSRPAPTVRVPTPGPSISEMRDAIRNVVLTYNDIKVEAMSQLNSTRLADVLVGDELTRRRQSVCYLVKEERRYEYSERNVPRIQDDDIDIIEAGQRATVLANISEHRILRRSSGQVITDYGIETYRAFYKLLRRNENTWKIDCLTALEDDEPLGCEVTFSGPDPCQ